MTLTDPSKLRQMRPDELLAIAQNQLDDVLTWTMYLDDLTRAKLTEAQNAIEVADRKLEAQENRE